MSYQAQEVEELNRQIAAEVMGEPEPPAPPVGTTARSADGSWRVVQIWDYADEPEWEPVAFSGDMDLAMRAVDKAFADYVSEHSPQLAPVIVLQHPTPDWEWLARIVEGVDPCKRPSSQGFGETAPEAIVRCLLAFVEQKGSHAKEENQ